MKSPIYIVLFITVSFVIFASGSQYNQRVSATGDDNQLIQALNQHINNHANLQGAIASVSIRSAENGELIYDHVGDVRLRPASNLKLFTGAAALAILGEDYTFKTELLTDGRQNGKTLHGNLYLKGKGDPTLLKSDLDEMAKNMKKLGVKKIDGDLIGDDSWYDNVRYSLDLPWSDEQMYYGAAVSALTLSPNKEFDGGTVIIEIKPNKAVNKKAEISITPSTDYIKVVNKVETVSGEEKHLTKISRDHHSDAIMIDGSLPIDSNPIREWVAVKDPTDYTLAVFKESLAKHGIKVEGKVKPGKTPDKSRVLHSHSSIPLSEIMVPFMKLSNNTHAEMLIKEIGKVKMDEGSWEKGIEIMKSELTGLGVNTDTLVIRDGSGISHVNLVPANEITKLLYAVQGKEWFDTYLHSLPVSGDSDRMDGGTLRYRLNTEVTKGKVIAKTGTISTVSSLSGYIETKSGEKLIFSILLNNLIQESMGKIIEDEIVTIIANH